jgi:hypothetical protein
MLEVLRGNSPGVSRTGTFPTPSGSSQFKQDNTHSVSGLAGLSTPSVEVSLHPPGCLRFLGELFLSRIHWEPPMNAVLITFGMIFLGGRSHLMLSVSLLAPHRPSCSCLATGSGFLARVALVPPIPLT